MSLRQLENEAIELEKAQARQSMRWYARWMTPHYILDPYHNLLCDVLDRVLNNELKRLMVVAPPQGGKSLTVSNLFASKWMAMHPDKPGMFISYGVQHATDKARDTRDLMGSPAFRELYPNTVIRQDKKAAGNFKIAGHRGGMLATGWEGQLTGFPGGMVVIDDPHKNMAEVRSRATREKVWSEYRDLVIPRVWHNAPMVIISTRWDVDDLIGRILRHTREKWEIIRIPALSETQADRDAANKLYNLPPGLPDPLGRLGVNESYFPALWPSEFLLEKRYEMGELSFAAEYQGAPRLAEGNTIKRVWLQKFVPFAPAKCRRVRYWDKAGTEDGGTYSASVLIAKDDEDRFFIEHAVRGQWSPDQRDKLIIATAETDAARTIVPGSYPPNMRYEDMPGYNEVETWLEQEPASGGKQSAQISKRQLSKWGARTETATGDKDIRLRPFAAACERGDVFIVRGDWNDEYIDSLCGIREGVFEDRDYGDCSAGGFNKLEEGGWHGGSVSIRPSDDDFWEVD